MFWRISILGLIALVGAVVGWNLADALGALFAVVSLVTLWFCIDVLHSLRMLRWLRAGAEGDAPVRHGVWSEVGDRVRRLQRLADQKVVRSEQRLQDFLAAIQASPNGVVLLDAGGRIEWFNQTAADHFGFDAQRDLLQLIGNLVRDPGFAAYYAHGDFSADISMPGRQTRSSRPVRLAVQLHPYGEGRKLLLSTDITALEQAETMRRDFVANVSHEIRTPLTVLSGFVETLQSLALEPTEQSRYLALMGQQAQRMQTLVNDLLTLSRLEGSPVPGTHEWTPVAVLMESCQSEAQELSGHISRGQNARHNLRFSVTHSDPPCDEIGGSAVELQSAIGNLVGNAVRYTPAGGLIEVSWTDLPGGGAEFAVRDSGPGIAPEHLPRLTERFYRVDRSRSRESGGTGLGLAIVKHVAQRHGAELQIESSPGMGSRFSLRFPAARLRARVPGPDAVAWRAAESASA